jgi:hypothetical protein
MVEGPSRYKMLRVLDFTRGGDIIAHNVQLSAIIAHYVFLSVLNAFYLPPSYLSSCSQAGDVGIWIVFASSQVQLTVL